MKYLFPVLAGICFFHISVVSQNLFPDPGPVFKDDIIPRMDILLHPDSLEALYQPGNETSNHHYLGTFVFDNGEIKDTVEQIGFRFRGNTSRFSAKKSFKVSFNTYEPGRQWYGLEKLNINGEHNDPSVCRSKIGWDLCREMGIPAPRSNHVDLYINGNFWGVYVNVEHVDEELVESRFGNKDGNLYKCLWPADLDYKGDNPDLYKEYFGGRRAYDLKTNEAQDDYSDLAHFIGVLNNTPLAELACELEKVFNVDTYLKVIAMDILTANWDGPIFNKNNFYLYHNQATGQFDYIPYDLDNTFGIDWFGIDWPYRDLYEWHNQNEPRPLYTRIMEVEEYRNRFSFYMNRFLTEIYNPNILNPYIENIKLLISPSAENDPLRPLDYGFSFDDFLSSFDGPLSVNHVKTGLKPFISERRISAILQLDLENIEPVIRDIINNYPDETQELKATASVFDDEYVNEVQFCYSVNGSNVICEEMADDGQHGDGAFGDGVHGILLPPFQDLVTIEYYILASDNTGLESRNPRCDYRRVHISDSSYPLVINEFMPLNNSTIPDNYGEFEDWIEVFNPSGNSIFLGSFYLSDNPDIPGKWQMPDDWIQPGEYQLFWADKDEEQGDNHTNFRLSSGGEFVGIFYSQDTDFGMIDGFEYEATGPDNAIGRLPNGTGLFQEVYPTPGGHNEPLNSIELTDNQSIIVKTFPNPFSKNLNIHVTNPLSKIIKLTIRDVLGRPFNEMAETKESIEITLPTINFPAGHYFLVLETEGQIIYSKKLISSQ